MNKALEIVFLFAVVLKITSTSDAGNKTRTCFNAVNAIKQLVAPDKYDKAMRPCENGGPVLVRVGIYIVSINKVRESDMELDIQVYFRQTWKDPRLAYGKLNLSHESYIQFSPGYVWDAMWLPDPYFANEKSATLHTIMSKNQLLRLSPDGSVFFSSRLTLTLSCPMVFHDFPMDRQTCKMTFLSYGYSTRDVVYDWLTNKTETSVYWGQLELPQFSIDKIEIERRVDSYTVGDFTVLILHIHFHRRVEFYLTRNYIPAALVVMVTWLSFWVDRESAPARVGMGITTILTMTTLLIGVGQQDLPVVSYMKALDWYYIGCFIFVFSGLCEFAMVNFFDASHRRHVNDLRIKASTSSVKETQEDLDVIPNGGIANYGFQYGMDLRPHGSPNECQESKVEEPKPSACFFHLSDRIESVARITFPLLFFIFNMVYWMRYRDSFIT